MFGLRTEMGLACRLVMLMVIVLCGSGCSIKMLYNNADRIARWGVNDYIRMDEAQEAYFETQVEWIHYWHRTTELPLYADYLDAMPGNIDNGVSEGEVQEIFDTLYSWWVALEAKSRPMVTELLLSLSDEQVARLPERLEEDNAKFREDEHDKPLDRIQTEWMKSYSDAMSRFSGRLTKQQRDYLTAKSVEYVPQFGLWADYRRRWQGDLLELLHERRDDPEVFSQAFAALMDNRETYYGAELQAIFDTNEKLAREVTAWLLNDLNDVQRERFYERLREMATMLRELAAEVPDSVPEGGGCLVRC